MKLLMLSRDPDIFRENSEARARMIDYGTIFEELHIVVLAGRENHNAKSKMQNDHATCQIAHHVFAYPATFFSAFRVASFILHTSQFVIQDSFITSQDPFELGVIGCLLKRKFKLPLQLQIHTDFLSPHFGRESLKNRMRVALAKRLIKKADSLRVVSERIKRSLTSNLQPPTSNLIVLPIFVDIQKIKKMPAVESLHQKYPGRFIILMASRLTREKNIALALEAMRALKKEQALFSARPLLVVAGDGPERKNLELQIKKHEVGDYAVIEPYREDLVSYYKTADLFLLTSQYEGYGRTVVEAVAAGCPVIMTDVGCAGEIIKDGVNGFVTPVGSARALTEKLGAVLKNPKALEPLRRAPLPDLPSKKEYLARYAALFGKSS